MCRSHVCAGYMYVQCYFIPLTIHISNTADPYSLIVISLLQTEAGLVLILGANVLGKLPPFVHMFPQQKVSTMFGAD